MLRKAPVYYTEILPLRNHMYNDPMTRFMGIDYGSKRVGVALSDESHTVAMPKATFPNDRNLFGSIKALCAGHDVKAIVMGESKDYKGNDNAIMKDITFFKGELERELHLPVHLEPEYMTSHEAARNQNDAMLLDASAAALILQSYLDKKK